MTNLETIKNIAYLEPECSFSEMAMDEFCKKFDLNCFTTPIKTIKQLVDYVATNPDTVGVLPLENTQDGTIRETFDCIMTSSNPNLKIISELILPIEYCLLSKTTEFYSITGLVATPRLNAKCHNFISNELPRNLNLIESSTMLESARELNNHNLTFSCIGNKKIAQHCMLNVLKSNINDDKDNMTKYILIGDIETTPTTHDKTTLAFRTNNTPGALLEILKIFLENNINLTYISSQPSKSELNEYIFIITFDGHIQNNNMLKIISEIKPKTSFCRYLGSYPEGKIIE